MQRKVQNSHRHEVDSNIIDSERSIILFGIKWIMIQHYVRNLSIPLTVDLIVLFFKLDYWRLMWYLKYSNRCIKYARRRIFTENTGFQVRGQSI